MLPVKSKVTRSTENNMESIHHPPIVSYVCQIKINKRSVKQ